MNILVKEFTNEMNKPKEQPKVTSFYKYKLNDPYNFDHNIGFTPKYNLKVWDKPISNYNDNKYNLKRENKDYELAYKTDDFTPDSYYQFNLKNMTNDKMRLNNYQTELEIGNDFNRRIRNDDTGETLQEIKAEDDERITSFKSLLTEYNENYSDAITEDDKDEIKDKYENDKITQSRKYNKPTIMKVPENNEFNKKIQKAKKIALSHDRTNLNLNHSDLDIINDAIDKKKLFYRETKEKKKAIINDIDDMTKDMIKEIKRKNDIKKIQNENKKIENEKIENERLNQDKINKDYLSSISFKDMPIEIPTEDVEILSNLSNSTIRNKIDEIICADKVNPKLTENEKNLINTILILNNINPLGAAGANKDQMSLWLKQRNII